MADRKPNPNRDRARDLARTIASMSDGDRAEFAMRAPVATVDGRVLSPKNMILAMMQKADATMVGGFRQWIGAGRVVKQGEAAIYIWIPSTRRLATMGEAGEESAESDAGAIEETRFFLAPVFDVSQTVELAATGQAEAA